MWGLYPGDRSAWGHGGWQHHGAGDLLHAGWPRQRDSESLSGEDEVVFGGVR